MGGWINGEWNANLKAMSEIKPSEVKKPRTK